MNYFLGILFTFNFCLSQEVEYIDSSNVKNPSLAWKLSFVPGLGQIYNKKYIKAIGFLGAEYFVIKRLIEYEKIDRIGKRNTYAWWTFGIYVLNILDAYVDAHLSTFPLRRLESNEISDSVKVN